MPGKNENDHCDVIKHKYIEQVPERVGLTIRETRQRAYEEKGACQGQKWRKGVLQRLKMGERGLQKMKAIEPQKST